MTYPQALRYLNSFFNLEHLSQFSYWRDLNLKRMKILLSWFAHPDHRFKSVLVAGTKGKGSTAFFLSSLLQANGQKVGLYTSPHLSDFRERIRVNGELISRTDLARLVTKIKSVVEARRKKIRALEPISFFEISTLLALLYFAEEKVDWAVLEVGMGGRLDATNAVKQSLSVFTLIGLDHEEHLGRTVRAIAGEKAAIMKRGVPFISARQRPEAFRVIRSRGKQVGARGFFCGADFNYEICSQSTEGSRFDFKMRGETLSNCAIRLAGAFQIENASVALAGLMVLKNRFKIPVSEKLIRKGLLAADWPGRFEIIRREGKIFILDGAHNGDSIRALAQSVRQLFPKRKVIVVFGISREKNLQMILPILSRCSRILIATQADHPRAQLTKYIIEAAKPYFDLTIPAKDMNDAMACFKRIQDSRTIALVTGSLFLVGEARELLRQ